MSPRPGTNSGTSSASTNDGTPSNVTRSQLPSRHVAVTWISPAAVSSTTEVSGSTIGTVPVSSKRGDHADRVRAAHRVGTVGLADDEPGIGLGIERGEHEVGAGLRSTTRFEAQELADRVVDLVDVTQLVAHRRARHLEHRAEVARALLALGVDLDRGVRPRRAHRRLSSWRTARRGPGRARRGARRRRRR